MTLSNRIRAAAPATVTVTTKRTVMLPTLPNFLRTQNDESLDVMTLSDEQLREIGAQWTDALVRKARDRRQNSIREMNKELQKQRENP